MLGDISQASRDDSPTLRARTPDGRALTPTISRARTPLWGIRKTMDTDHVIRALHQRHDYASSASERIQRAEEERSYFLTADTTALPLSTDNAALQRQLSSMEKSHDVTQPARTRFARFFRTRSSIQPPVPCFDHVQEFGFLADASARSVIMTQLKRGDLDMLAPIAPDKLIHGLLSWMEEEGMASSSRCGN
jgi:hypothetical protein